MVGPVASSRPGLLRAKSAIGPDACECETTAAIRRFPAADLSGCAKGSHSKSVTLDETIAAETAQLLIDAAEARKRATKLDNEREAADLLSYASTLEDGATKWEQRLHWWKLLRQRRAAR